MIAGYGEITAESAPSESADITGRAGDYVNKVIVCRTTLSLSDFTLRMSEIETAGGRQSNSPLVAVDIDTVMWDGEVISPSDFGRPYFLKLYNGLIQQALELKQ